MSNPPVQPIDDIAIQALSDAGAICGDCGSEPGDRVCPDCERCRGWYVAALRAAGWAPGNEELTVEVNRLRAELAQERENYQAYRIGTEGAKAIAVRHITDLDRMLTDTIDDRDRAQEIADKLAYAVAPEEVIGEHSSMNCPWTNAFELITPKADVDKLRARVAELEGPAVEARAALAALCYDLEDPGSNALGALHLISRVTVGVEAPKDEAAQVLASREAQIMRRCGEFVRDTYDGEWADDAASTLERDADVRERGCPGYEKAYRGESEAEHRLANCANCGRPRASCTAP